MNRIIKTTLLAVLLSSSYLTVFSQKKEVVKPIKFGDMNSWLVRQIDESFVIGGNTRYIYEIAERGDTLKNNTPYKNTNSPWALSSVLAKVKGVTKASVTVFPEKRDAGYAARLETRLETVKVLGLINISVLASGTIFLGEMVEPITSTDNPQSKLVTGIPFTERPTALQYDYKVKTGGQSIKATGFGRQNKLNTNDMAEVFMILQYRWENPDGSVHAKRVATSWERFEKSVDTWQNKHRATLHYGDISKSSFYKDYMGLKNGDKAVYTRNSKGKMVPIIEEEWAPADHEVTHIILQFSSSNGGAYIGNPESRLWIDNVGLVYQ